MAMIRTPFSCFSFYSFLYPALLFAEQFQRREACISESID